MSWLPSISLPGWSRPSNGAPVPARLTVGATSQPRASTSRRAEPSGMTNDADDSDDDTPTDPDAPPMFPALHSAQRSTGPPPPPSFALAPPSPTSASSSTSVARPSPGASAGSSMAPPPSTTSRPAFGIKAGGDDAGALASSSSGASAVPKPAAKKSRKVALQPGCSALDWARLCASGDNLRGIEGGFLRVTLDDLAEHNTRDDAWSAYNGRVYNMTEYLRFHPGGEKELMRAAGRDGTKLFMQTHSWVNIEHMLGPCLVGMLVRG